MHPHRRPSVPAAARAWIAAAASPSSSGRPAERRCECRLDPRRVSPAGSSSHRSPTSRSDPSDRTDEFRASAPGIWVNRSTVTPSGSKAPVGAAAASPRPRPRPRPRPNPNSGPCPSPSSSSPQYPNGGGTAGPAEGEPSTAGPTPAFSSGFIPSRCSSGSRLETALRRQRRGLSSMSMARVTVSGATERLCAFESSRKFGDDQRGIRCSGRRSLVVCVDFLSKTTLECPPEDRCFCYLYL